MTVKTMILHWEVRKSQTDLTKLRKPCQNIDHVFQCGSISRIFSRLMICVVSINQTLAKMHKKCCKLFCQNLSAAAKIAQLLQKRVPITKLCNVHSIACCCADSITLSLVDCSVVRSRPIVSCSQEHKSVHCEPDEGVEQPQQSSRPHSPTYNFL